MRTEPTPRRRGLLLASLMTLLLLCGTFVRWHHLGDVYTEYDDVGLLANTKFHLDRRLDFELPVDPLVRVRASVDMDALRTRALDSALYGAYVGYSWTYPPGQYVLYPLLLDEADSYRHKLFVGRAVSALMSSLSLGLLAYLLYGLNRRRLDASMLPPLALLAFSLNSVLYAHHMSPYSMTVTCMLASMVLFHRLVEGRLSPTAFGGLLGVLTWCSYLVLPSLPLFALLYAHARRRDGIGALLANSWRGVLLYAVCFAPLSLLFFKPSAGMHGAAPPPIHEGIVPFVTYFPSQFALAAGSVLASASVAPAVNGVLAAILVAGALLVLARRFSAMGPERYTFAFCASFLAEWVVLHALEKLPMDQTRHILLWTPLLCVLAFLLVRALTSSSWGSAVAMAGSLVLAIPGLLQCERALDDRLEAFRHDLVAHHPATTVLTYSATVAPLLYLDGEKTVYDVDTDSFWRLLPNLTLPDRMVLVSQDRALDDYLGSPKNGRLDEMLEDFRVIPLHERPSETYFTFNDVSVGCSQANGFYMYEMERVPSSP